MKWEVTSFLSKPNPTIQPGRTEGYRMFCAWVFPCFCCVCRNGLHIVIVKHKSEYKSDYFCVSYEINK